MCSETWELELFAVLFSQLVDVGVELIVPKYSTDREAGEEMYRVHLSKFRRQSVP